MTDLRYPIGEFRDKPYLTPAERREAIEHLSHAAQNLQAAVSGLTADQLDTPYRLGRWNVRQVAHHLADSHMNGYIRFKLALTENEPTIKPYDEARWAELSDSIEMPPQVSIEIFDALHKRWVALCEAMTPAQFALCYHHPERGICTLDGRVRECAWHSRHHVAQITALRERMGWH
jgi:hypothetical protein